MSCKRDFSPLQAQQTRLSCSLYSWADVHVIVCFNFDRFQVASAPTSPFSPSVPAADIEALFFSPFFSLSLSTPGRHHSVPSITLSSSLPFAPFLSHLFFPFFLISLSPPVLKKRLPESLWISVQSGG